MSGTVCGAMGSIIIEEGQSVDPWEPSSLKGTECGSIVIEGDRV